ncbi:MAG: 16S rRNA (cytosine(967)-C(5))-methyltransferase RsmB [Deltaproteobacteria bacterium]|nr:16S rRNA (cytosine(967)-C(5))-methyltransferase RsmB [Deltaproteobacteria bacterium]
MDERPQRPGRGRPDGVARRRGAGPTLARLIAVRVLERVERVRAYSDIALHHALAQSNLSGQDRALATDLVYGTLRWRGRIDHVLSQFVERKLADLESMVLTTLRLGAYQILFSDRIPNIAAVDEAVRCARAVGADRATGLVNAVLRRVASDGGAVRFPLLEDEPVLHLQHALSLPTWIAERWIADYGAEAAANLARICNDPPPFTVRANRQRTNRETLLGSLLPDFPEAAPCRMAPDGLVLGHKGDPGRDARFRDGDYTVQDEASQLVVEMLDPQPSDRVLDVCAAPGTKTTAIAERLGEDGSVLALDRHAARLNLVARAARRLGLRGISTLQCDANVPLPELPFAAEQPIPKGGSRFDRVLVDAPCSGLGAMRRNPDARWRVRPTDPAQLAEVQQSILANAAVTVRPGGVLVYSTCSVLREENEAVVEQLLARYEDFRLATSAELPTALAPTLDESGYMRCHPHIHGTDGFFAARLIRET